MLGSVRAWKRVQWEMSVRGVASACEAATREAEEARRPRSL